MLIYQHDCVLCVCEWCEGVYVCVCAVSREKQWPSLALMVKQYFAAPASSAGVERVFSAAGKMHSDLRKAMKDNSLQHSIIAAYNVE